MCVTAVGRERRPLNGRPAGYSIIPNNYLSTVCSTDDQVLVKGRKTRRHYRRLTVKHEFRLCTQKKKGKTCYEGIQMYINVKFEVSIKARRSRYTPQYDQTYQEVVHPVRKPKTSNSTPMRRHLVRAANPRDFRKMRAAIL